jgi:hypothetical protein
LLLSAIAPFVPTSTNLFADFQFHDLLAQQSNAFTQKVDIFI